MMIESILSQYQQQGGDPAGLLAELVAEIRPPRLSQTEHAVHALQALCHVLNADAEKAALLRTAILQLLGERKPLSLLVDSGVQPSSGFFTELARRMGDKILPAAIDPGYLKDLFSLIFTRRDDDVWVSAVTDGVWLQLLEALDFSQAPAIAVQSCNESLVEAAQVLSYRIAAAGLEPELIRNHPELENHRSPFVMQNQELLASFASTTQDVEQFRHIEVMLDQCRSVIARIRRNSSQTGTSIRLTFLLQRLTQQLVRLQALLGLIAGKGDAGQPARYVQLFKLLVHGECHKNAIRLHWRENMELLALRVTENASRTGEHYITETRSEYFSLMRSAMGAGLIVGVMAMIKLITAGQHHAPLTEAILFSLNYGLGFVLIHMLHFTVATKQPAMTAAAIAASIDNSESRSRNMDKLVNIIAQTMRSQIAAIFGNVVIAIPTAIAIGALVYLVTGEHFVSTEKAARLLADIDPVHSGALIYAGVAGVCLFLSGLIAGYHDNLAIYDKIPQRLRALNWLQTLLGRPRLDRLASYVENNLGALAGNFYFGCLLGGMAGIGVLLGLPIDIRHITFSSAFFGFSLVGTDFVLPLQVLWLSMLGILLIGAVNLTVSFTLALYVAMKSRKVSFSHWRLLLRTLAIRLWQNPRQFLLPPKRMRTPAADEVAGVTGVDGKLQQSAQERAHASAPDAGERALEKKTVIRLNH